MDFKGDEEMSFLLSMLGMMTLALVVGCAAYSISLDIDEWLEKRKKKKEKKR
jgi:hypothetical protein